jgi:putative transmembrane protein PGPGW
MLRVSYRGAKRIVVFVVGGTVCLVGLLLLVLPGPGTLVLLLGLSLLATEFVWARVWLRRLRVSSRRAVRRARGWRWWSRRRSKED